jgi:NAD(P)-dependent dehydrogenase (short-subunit alcohol dehydrogenase family)
VDEPARGGVVVTGASSGIGAATARELAGRGFVVGCLSRRGSVPAGAAPGAGELIGFSCDVTDEHALERTLGDFVERAGGIVGLVNNAGLHEEVPSAELTLDQLRRVLELNVVAAFSACRLAYPHLRERGGLIVNLGSFYDHLGVRSNLAYSASKAAVASMTRTLAVEWARDGISALAVAPGYVLTELNREFFADPKRREAVERRIPLGRIGQPEEVGRLIGALFEARVPFMTGATIYVDGAQGISL